MNLSGVCLSMKEIDFLLIKAQLEIVSLFVALSTKETPKHSSIFETTHKVDGGKEVTITRSPNGRFASKSQSADSSNNVLTVNKDEINRSDLLTLTTLLFNDPVIAPTNFIDITIPKLQKQFSDFLQNSKKELKAKSVNKTGAEIFGEQEQEIQALMKEENIDYLSIINRINKHDTPKEVGLDASNRLKRLRISLAKLEMVMATLKEQANVSGFARLELPEFLKVYNDTKLAVEDLQVRQSNQKGYNYSIQKRVKELAELKKNNNKDSLNYKWRLGVIKAEVKYGDNLDKIDDPNGYDNLLMA